MLRPSHTQGDQQRGAETFLESRQETLESIANGSQFGEGGGGPGGQGAVLGQQGGKGTGFRPGGCENLHPAVFPLRKVRNDMGE